MFDDFTTQVQSDELASIYFWDIEDWWEEVVIHDD